LWTDSAEGDMTGERFKEVYDADIIEMEETVTVMKECESKTTPEIENICINMFHQK
jgi:hypothetical protein